MIPPEGKNAWTVKIGEKGQFVIPKEARDMLGVKPGDTILVLGDKERGIAINKLATMSDVKQSTLDNIVRGLTKNPGVKTLHKIALAFNMTLAEFLDFEELNEYSFDDDNGEE